MVNFSNDGIFGKPESIFGIRMQQYPVQLFIAKKILLRSFNLSTINAILSHRISFMFYRFDWENQIDTYCALNTQVITKNLSNSVYISEMKN